MTDQREMKEEFSVSKGALGGDTSNSFDVYIRMNDDADKDFCFNVNKNGTKSPPFHLS